MADVLSFAALIEVHQWLDELFVEHQIALLSLDLSAAVARLQRYENKLALHIKDEEELLIPLYAARTSKIPGGAVEMFTGEHTKLNGFVAEFFRTLSALQGQAGNALERGVIKLFDREALRKGLVEHHHAREQNILFPWLDKVTAIDERAELLDRCASLKALRRRMA